MTRVSTVLLIGLLVISTPATSVDVLKQGQDLLKGLDTSSTAKTSATKQGSSLSVDELGSGLKDALWVGSVRVVEQLGAADGFNGDSNIRIPLPEDMKMVQSTLVKFGMSGMLDDLEVRLNRAAEAATPKAKQLFLDAISEMSLEDARAIYDGPQDAATRYFQAKMSEPLADEMTPIVTESLSSAGAIEAYDKAMGEYDKLPFTPDVTANLTEHVVEKGMDGIFYYLAKEEAAIRTDPIKRTTPLLQKVFGAQ